jgi:hypothetical protein
LDAPLDWFSVFSIVSTLDDDGFWVVDEERSGHTSQNAQQQEIPTTMSWCRRRENGNTKPSMDELATEIDDLVESSVASNTWKVYKAAVDSFQNLVSY